jgi:predicted ATP-grasp superfamily ATP-dependent carboligase
MKNLAKAARTLLPGVDAVAFSSGIENEPRLAALSKQRLVLGNTPEAVRGVRDMQRLASALPPGTLEVPQTLRRGDPLPDYDNDGSEWLVKDLALSGGSGVRFWKGTRSQRSLGRQAVLQRYIPGLLYSAAFAADGKDAVLLGITRQYAGVPELGAQGFQWCGNVAPIEAPELAPKVQSAVQALVGTFHLLGLNGIDFISHAGVLYLLEVNPRCGASVELFELAQAINAFELHVAACQGKLRLPQPLPGGDGRSCWGKGILYAGRELKMPDTGGWLARGIHDIPASGEVIPAGVPICTVMGTAAESEVCWENVLQRAAALRTEIEAFNP